MRAAPDSIVFPRVEPRTLVGFLLFFYCAWTLRVVLLMPVDHALPGILAQNVWSQFWRILLWGGLVLWMLMRVHRVPPGAALGLTSFPHGRAMFECLAIGALWLLITALFGVFAEGKKVVFSLHPSAAQWGVIAATVIWAPFFEEVAFRGYVYQALRGHMRFTAAALVSAVLFAAAHWPGWLYLQGLHAGLIPQTASIAVVGFVLALVFERGQSLWPCVVLHLCNNLLWAGPPG